MNNKSLVTIVSSISLFLLASCGGAESVSYDKAYAFVSKNYTNVLDRKQTKSTYKWDFSKSTGDGKEVAKALVVEMVPDVVNPGLTGQKVLYNYYVSHALNANNFSAYCPDVSGAKYFISGKNLTYQVTETTPIYGINISEVDKDKYDSDGYITYQSAKVTKFVINDNAKVLGQIELFCTY